MFPLTQLIIVRLDLYYEGVKMTRQWSKHVAPILEFFHEYYLRLLCLTGVILYLNLYCKHFGMGDKSSIFFTSIYNQWRTEGGGVGGSAPPPNSEVFTKSNRNAN